MNFPKRASQSVKIAERLRSLWRGDKEQMYPLTHNSDGPPIWMGGAGPRTLERTGRLFDGWFPLATSPETFRSGLRSVRQAADDAGRSSDSITASAYLTVVFGEADKAQAQLAEHSELYYGVPYEQISRAQGSIAGSVEKVVDWLDEFVSAGVEHLCIRFGCEDISGQLETLAGVLHRYK